MSQKPVITGILLLSLLAVGIVLFFIFGERPVEETLSRNRSVIGKSAAPAQREGARLEKRPVLEPGNAPVPAVDSSEGGIGESRVRPMPETAAQKPAASEPSTRRRHVEEIKEEIYARNIESVEQIPLLDELVQTGGIDTRQFWGDGWTSVDDWKKDENGFVLEQRADGTMVFQPDAETARMYTFFQSPQRYTYDAENREFVNEVDYYGKTIYNVVKFINDDVLVMMTISGRKVDLNIYQKNAGQLVDTQTPQAPSSRPRLTGRSALQPGS